MIIRVCYECYLNYFDDWELFHKDFEDTEEASEFIKRLYDDKRRTFVEFRII